MFQGLIDFGDYNFFLFGARGTGKSMPSLEAGIGGDNLTSYHLTSFSRFSRK